MKRRMKKLSLALLFMLTALSVCSGLSVPAWAASPRNEKINEIQGDIYWHTSERYDADQCTILNGWRGIETSEAR